MSEAERPITRLLADARAGSDTASSQLSAVLYEELREAARRQLGRDAPDSGVRPTALVNEVYARLVEQGAVHWSDRAEFLAVASSLMRRLVVEQAARAGRAAPAWPAGEVVAIDAAMQRLAAVDPQQAKVVELRYFAGLTIEEAAEALGIPVTAAELDWAMGRAWLRGELAPPVP
jgi:RNA polymerase sigma factor (TIGR02999 family)